MVYRLYFYHKQSQFLHVFTSSLTPCCSVVIGEKTLIFRMCCLSQHIPLDVLDLALLYHEDVQGLAVVLYPRHGPTILLGKPWYNMASYM